MLGRDLAGQSGDCSLLTNQALGHSFDSEDRDIFRAIVKAQLTDVSFDGDRRRLSRVATYKRSKNL